MDIISTAGQIVQNARIKKDVSEIIEKNNEDIQDQKLNKGGCMLTKERPEPKNPKWEYYDCAFNLDSEAIELLGKMPSDRTVCSPEPTVNYDNYFPEGWRIV